VLFRSGGDEHIRLAGGDGADLFMLDDAVLPVGIDGGAGVDTVRFGQAFSGSASDLAGIITSVEVLDFSRNAAADTLTFSQADVQGIADAGAASGLTVQAGANDTIDAVGYESMSSTPDGSLTVYHWSDGTELHVQKAA